MLGSLPEILNWLWVGTGHLYFSKGLQVILMCTQGWGPLYLNDF